MAKRTYKTLQAGRGLAALAVVFHHAADYIGLDPRFWQNVSYAHDFAWGAYGVQFFFVLSGIVILLAHWKDQGTPATLRSYAFKRFRRIYPIYWVVLACVAAPYLLNPALGHGFERDPWVLISSFALVHIGTLGTTLHVAWTLFHEVLFYSFFALILLDVRVGYSVGAAWLLGSAVVLCGFHTNPWFENFFSPLHILFALGMFVTWVLQTRPKIGWKLPLGLGFVFLLCAITLSLKFNVDAMLPSLMAGLASALLILGLLELERREHFVVWNSLVFLGDASYSIYLVHFPVLSIGARKLYGISHTVHAPIAVWLIANALVGLVAGIAVHVAIERPLLKWIPR